MPGYGVNRGKSTKSHQLFSGAGNRLLLPVKDWAKLLGYYADGFSSIFVPECVPCIIPHMFQQKKFIYSF